MGTARIEIKEMEKIANSNLMYCKRAQGLLKKASDLCSLRQTDMVLIMFSPIGILTQHKGRKIEEVIGQLAERIKTKSVNVEFPNKVGRELGVEVRLMNLSSGDQQLEVQSMKQELEAWRLHEGIDHETPWLKQQHAYENQSLNQKHADETLNLRERLHSQKASIFDDEHREYVANTNPVGEVETIEDLERTLQMIRELLDQRK